MRTISPLRRPGARGALHLHSALLVLAALGASGCGSSQGSDGQAGGTDTGADVGGDGAGATSADTSAGGDAVDGAGADGGFDAGVDAGTDASADVGTDTDTDTDTGTDAGMDGSADADSDAATADSANSADATGPCAVDGAACDDGDPCTSDDACKAGSCQGGAKTCSGPTWATVYQDAIVANGCSNCHSHFGSAQDAYDFLIGGSFCGGKLVVPGDAAASLLLNKVTQGAPLACGVKMPKGTSGLPKAASDALKAWIEAGAKP